MLNHLSPALLVLSSLSTPRSNFLIASTSFLLPVLPFFLLYLKINAWIATPVPLRNSCTIYSPFNKYFLKECIRENDLLQPETKCWPFFEKLWNESNSRIINIFPKHPLMDKLLPDASVVIGLFWSKVKSLFHAQASFSVSLVRWPIS